MLQNPSDQAQGPELPLRPLSEFDGSLSQRTYLALREAIMALAIPPGAILRKPEICEALGVSRSPVSEAMARLAGEGLVDIVPQAGSFVSRFSMAELREGAFLREAIELHAVAHVAGTITDETLTILRRNIRIQEALVEDADFAGFYAQDAALHAVILDATGFRRIAQVAETAWVQVNRARQLVLPVPGRVAETLEEHRAILAALEARDAEAARAAMGHHLRQLMTFLQPLERAHPEYFTSS
ncbi:GntR family transcriptional regulator [Ovoidimarina sediminis]|uniref:GntR family transcriptional regulator n=1 Tax=Ovoidimarina sediminis TaxID=3079856 RepID=UPI0029104896|nr:GntR family transcriptional regulator [Rhodophyticola sp. MJ-SS7]MDU8942741.1 GntR family transcriptional regulator [Rhodophyticola sp. MJ-SS7]